MKEELRKIESWIKNPPLIQMNELKNELQSLFSKLKNQIEEYIGDYPTFIEPVYLERDVKIGDDVLLGPNVYIGAHTKIGDYVELSNTIIYDNVKIGNNFKLENCIVAPNSHFDFEDFKSKSSLLFGSATSEKNLQKILL
jgi:NDP-sugar pyrophosphorylase family protein